METEINPQELKSSITDSAPNGRRLSKKSLGLLAAAAVAAGSIGSVALMANPSAAEPTEPAEPTELTYVESTEVTEAPTLLGEPERVAEMIAPDVEQGHDWDDCPACGMG